MKVSDKLTDGFIYKWEKNGFVYYIGSSCRTYNKRDLTTEELLEESEMWHRKQGVAKYAKSRKNGGDYDYTLFRKMIQFHSPEFFEDCKPVFVTEPKDMTRGELLKLEGQYIRDLKKIGQCVWNIDYDPYKTFKDKNG